MMSSGSIFQKTALTLLVLGLLAFNSFGQKPLGRGPRQEKLLNGLKVLMWSDPSADKVSVKLRIHSGSAFDPQGKEGVMKMLADNIFPTRESREFFTEDLGGGLAVVSNYDYIQFNATARPSEVLTLLETLSAAVTNPTIDKDTTERLKAAQTLAIAEKEKDPAYIADQAAAKRLFGTFPYGRPELGTKESVQKIDFADLRFAKDRFFGADNATIAISGNIDTDLVYRAVRRYFGSWLKADNKIPSTFRQPEDPDTKPMLVESLSPGSLAVRFAFRGVSRSDKDYAAAAVLGRILQARLQKIESGVWVANEARILPGVVMIGFCSAAVEKLPSELLMRITEAEFATAKAEAAADAGKKPVDELWLDADTYKISPAEDAQAVQKVTLTDVQRVADRLARNPVVSVAVKAGQN